MTIRYVLWRFWGVIIGMIMITLSLAFQALFFLLLAVVVLGQILPADFDPRLAWLVLLVMFNLISCFEYFRLRRVSIIRSTVLALGVVGGPRASHVSMAIFLVPRGIDRILTGKELVQ